MGRLLQALPILALAAAGCAAPPLGLEEVDASISLGELHPFFEAGAAIPLRVTIFNPGHQPFAIDPGLASGERLELLDAEGQRLPVTAGSSAAFGQEVAAGGRVSLDLDPAQLFPALSRPGLYRLTVVYPRFRSNTVTLRILPAFRLDADYRAIVETDRGTFSLSFRPDKAPNHVRNFVSLARSGFYENILVHRVVPGLVIQTGDPARSGVGGPGYTIDGEFNELPHKRGTLSMARREGYPHSAGSQWFVCLDRVPAWDRKYTVFGEVVGGMEVVELIASVPVKEEVPTQPIVVHRVRIEEGSQPSSSSTP